MNIDCISKKKKKKRLVFQLYNTEMGSLIMVISVKRISIEYFGNYLPNIKQSAKKHRRYLLVKKIVHLNNQFIGNRTFKYSCFRILSFFNYFLINKNFNCFNKIFYPFACSINFKLQNVNLVLPPSKEKNDLKF